jgi:septal ring factor EnvC (AmiA/AmiB activator)
MKIYRFFSVLALTAGLLLTACASPKKPISGYEFPQMPPTAEKAGAVEKTPVVSGTAEEIKRLENLIRQMEETEQRLQKTQRQTEEALHRIEEASRKTEGSADRIQKAQEKIEAVGSKQGPKP